VFLVSQSCQDVSSGHNVSGPLGCIHKQFDPGAQCPTRIHEKVK
jgi:hypothetical protein